MTEDIRNKRLLIVETASSVLWFLMDASWMFGLPTAAKALAALTILASMLIFRYSERSLVNWLVTAAMNAWACMNVFWMLHDIKALDWGLAPAQVFFMAGALCLLAAAVSARSGREALYAILLRFRRLRIRRKGDDKTTGS